MTTILGIETSCDETSAAIVDNGTLVRSNLVASQIDLHQKYGGVVPEIASRAHIERLDSIVLEAMATARCKATDLDAIAVTNRPGLVGALLIGVTAAKTLSWAWNLPLIAVNHIHAHAYSAAIAADVSPFPGIALVVSGGHTSLFRVDHPTAIQVLGRTSDDAAGEAFDKVATILGLPYPGGPQIERMAQDGDPLAARFPRSMLGADSLDFSFSGLKTSVLYHVNGPGKTVGGLEKMTPQQVSDTAASFQQAVIDVLVKKTMRAIKQSGLSSVTLGGGVAANATLRTALMVECQLNGIRFQAAKPTYCTDNAAMIAALAFHQLQAGDVASLDLDAYARA